MPVQPVILCIYIRWGLDWPQSFDHINIVGTLGQQMQKLKGNTTCIFIVHVNNASEIMEKICFV